MWKEEKGCRNQYLLMSISFQYEKFEWLGTSGVVNQRQFEVFFNEESMLGNGIIIIQIPQVIFQVHPTFKITFISLSTYTFFIKTPLLLSP